MQNLNKKLKRESFTTYERILTNLCQAYSNYPFTEEILRLLKESDLSNLVNYADSLSSQLYDDATTHFVANQFASLIRKYPFPRDRISFDPERTAYLKFEKSEHSCLRINQRLVARRLRKKGVHPYEPYFYKMRNFISYVIGFEPNMEQIYDKCGFGPGASIGVHGDATNAARKLSSELWSVTPSATYFAYQAAMRHAQIREVILPCHGGFTSGDANYLSEKISFWLKTRVVQHNKITFVPKTAKTYRSIAIEPLLNGFVQKGIDEHMRLKLKRIGIDLSDQSINSELAREGSLDVGDSFCTIDLSSASDSISIELCRELLPPEWFDLLDSTRSKSYAYNKVIKAFNKFCSMGNGFCFPLESLLFTAACDAVGAGKPGIDYHVYGDDIIIRRSYYDKLIDLLRYMGFSVNKDKTFSHGSFRESCGSDWFGGKDVRPFTLDYALDSIENVFKFLNLSRRSGSTELFFQSVRGLVIYLLPNRYRFFRPYPGPADSGIDSTGDEHLYVPSCRFSKETRLWEWKELMHLPIADKGWKVDAGDSVPAIMVFGALSGSSSDCPFAFRRKTRTKVSIVTHPGATSQWSPPIRY